MRSCGGCGATLLLLVVDIDVVDPSFRLQCTAGDVNAFCCKNSFPSVYNSLMSLGSSMSQSLLSAWTRLM